MTDLDEMARNLLAAEHRRRGSHLHADRIIADTTARENSALAAIRAALLNAPPGWKLVPAEPTGEMLRAALRAPCSGHPETGGQSYRGIYRAMIAAAPEPEA